MKILLINPNAFRNPPCIPVGLEYVADALERSGNSVHVMDMCYEDSPLERLKQTIGAEHFDFAGVTIRNIDTSQAARYVNFMPEIKAVVEELHGAGLKVVLGGSGFSGMTERIMQFTGADFGIRGPADRAIQKLCQEVKNGNLSGRIISGWELGIDPEVVPRRAVHINYAPYIEGGGIVGFATQYGCPERCLYCLEAGTALLHRRPAAVAEELRSLHAQGFTHYHLCDSEFNHDLKFCVDVLREIADMKLDIRWTLYMKPVPFGKDLLMWLKLAGVYLITLSVDSAAASASGGRYCWDDVAFVVRCCHERGIKLAIDLVVGMPGEPLHSVRQAIEFFRRERPECVNVNAWLRVYDGTHLEALLRTQPDLQAHLSDPLPPAPPLEQRVFYNHIDIEQLRDMIGGDAIFKLEGFDPGTNYEVIREKTGINI
ncbi:MAG: radical SAM protein [bacterium]